MWGAVDPVEELNSTAKWRRHSSPEQVARHQQVLRSGGGGGDRVPGLMGGAVRPLGLGSSGFY